MGWEILWQRAVSIKFCDYGCGNEAKYKFKNGKWCCSKSKNSCSANKLKNSQMKKGKFVGKNNWNYGKKRSKKTKEKIGLKQKSYKNHYFLTIKKIKHKYPFFSKIEKLRYNPDKPNEKEIQVHCKNHNCKNSQEKGGWFTPTRSQLYERIRHLEKVGADNCYFYCSIECKNICPLYRSHGGNNLKDNTELYTQNEYQQFREFVLERDKYICQYCGEPAIDVHHERPQKLEPFFSLDPDYAWSCCKKCHYEKGHKDECSTGKLATKNC